MKNVEYLVGSENIINTPLQVFSDEAMEFSVLLSKSLMKSETLRKYPDVSALAFWCRKANIMKMKDNFEETEKRLGRGLCFHIAPGNIPINFAFSYMFGLLSGCANIVRISNKQHPQVEEVCAAVLKTITVCPEVEKRTAFVKYGHDDAITEEFCKCADARVIWGGDKTISKIKTMYTKPRCIDICFADRYSFCIIDGNAVLDADKAKISRLIDNFYNDTYLMDQNACSSQQLIFWQNDSKEARDKFWNALYHFAKNKYKLQTALSMDKYTHMFEDILDGKPIDRVERHTNLVYRIGLSKLEGDLTKMRGKGGYFYEYPLGSLEEITPFITEKFQTVTYFGLDAEEVRKLVISSRLRGIDRIVPVGKAMEIGIMWDGFDLIRTLSRYVEKE